MHIFLLILVIVGLGCFFLDAFAGRSTTDAIRTPNFLARVALTPLGLFCFGLVWLLSGSLL